MSSIDETTQITPKPESFLSVFFRTFGICLVISYSYWVYDHSLNGVLTLTPNIGLIAGFLAVCMGPGLAVFVLLLMIVQRKRIALIGFQIVTYGILAFMMFGAAVELGIISV
jgi:hypothetical protein